MDYTYFYKYCYHSPEELAGDINYDVFVSSFCRDDRVQEPWNKIIASRKIWILGPESVNLIKEPDVEQYVLADLNEYEKILDFVDVSRIKKDDRVCIDSTGFVLPVLFLLIKCFQIHGLRHFDIIYSEPQRYIHAESTNFSEDYYDTSQIIGYAGVHPSDMSNDLLIVASGYDYNRISDVANVKKSVQTKVQLLGFPSMQADMYQENLVRAFKAESALGSDSFATMDMNIYAPAYDPFVTAQAIKDYLKDKQLHKPFTNIYLAPLSSKPQAIGIALFYLWEECHKKTISVIYPQCRSYITENSKGIGCVWRYTIELPLFC